MSGYAEDYDLDELSDDDLDYLEDDLDYDEELSERRRRRAGPRIRGRGYNRPRIAPTPVSQTQLQASMTRVGGDVRKLAAHSRTVGTRVARTQREMQQSMQMMALLPLLTKPKTIELKTGVDNLPAGTKVMVDDGDMMSMMLPLLLMGGMGGGMTGQGQRPGAGGMDMMMVVALMMAMDK
jgi:hypothetical protein